MKNLLLGLSILGSITIFADEFSYALLSKYIDTQVDGKITSGSSYSKGDDCYMIVKKDYSSILKVEFRTIDRYGQDELITSDSVAVGSGDDNNYFQKAGNLFYYYDYIEAVTSGHFSYSIGWASGREKRVYFNRDRMEVTGIQLIQHEYNPSLVTTCSFYEQ